MKIGMFTSGYQRYTLERAFMDAKRFGYDFIELWGGRPHAFAPDLERGMLSDIRTMIEKYEMPVLGYTPEHNGYPYNYMAGNKFQWEDSINYLKTAVRMGKAMGASFTLISTGHAGYDADKKSIEERLYRSLKILADYAESIDHKILLEPLTPFETNVCMTASDLKYILDKVDSPALGGMCDFAVPFVMGEPVMDYFYKLGSRIEHLHIVDNDRVSDSHIVPGEGCMPLKEIIGEIKGYGYGGTATIELVTAYMNEPSVYAKRALDNLRQMTG